jgi:signal transduction histidine kinase
MSGRIVRSLTSKLVGVVLVTTFAALTLALGAMIVYTLRDYHRSTLADMETQAELIGRMTAPALAFDDKTVAKANLGLLALRSQVQAAGIYSARGALFASYGRAGTTLEFPKLPAIDGVTVDGSQLTLWRRIVEQGEIVGTIYLRADYEMGERIRDYLGIAALTAIVAMVVAYLMSAPLQRTVIRPLLAIAQVSRAVVEQGDYSRRAEKLSDDEVGLLAESFNAMLAEIGRRTSELELANDELARQVAERDRAEQEVLDLNAVLESRVRERTAQLEAVNQELEAFCFSVSHDLRAPLRSIDGFGQALVEDFPDVIPDDARRYLARIRAATLRMGQLIEDLLNLSRLSRSPLRREPIDVGAIAREVAAELAQREPERQVEVSIWDGLQTEADPALVRVALENLISNAWKFSAHAAKPRIEIGALKDRGRQTFFVRDNGAGFDMAHAGKLFTPFQRLHSEREFVGTGIGLATVQRVVQRHGGRIWADAQTGMGATFYFTLAFHDELQPQPSGSVP